MWSRRVKKSPPGAGNISAMQRFLLPRREGFTYAGFLPVQTLAIQKSPASLITNLVSFSPPHKNVDIDCVCWLQVYNS